MFANGIFLAIGLSLLVSAVAFDASPTDEWTDEASSESWIDYGTGSDDSDDSNDSDDSDGSDTYEDRSYANYQCQGYTCNFRSYCGRAPLNPIQTVEPFIVNGEDQIHGEWPSFARLYVKFGSKWSICGGVVVSDKHILTAAHCVDEKTDTLTVEATVGGHNKRIEHCKKRIYNSSSVHVAEGYERETNMDLKLRHDWAVVTLKDPIKFSNYIQPACLPYGFGGEELTAHQYEHCYLVGVGSTDGKIQNATAMETDIIQKMRVKQVSCAKSFFKRNKYVTPTQACYTKVGSVGSACYGDSGGPILCIDRDTRRWTVIGIASKALRGCGNSDDSAAAFIRVPILLPVIKAETGL